ncbi:hypothetical protein ABH941_000275 [Streptacidiphilus sp. EB103A]
MDGGDAPRVQRQRVVGRVGPRLPGSARKDAASSPSTSCRGTPCATRAGGGPGPARSARPGRGAGPFTPTIAGVGEVQPRLGECWTRSASRIHPRMSPDLPNNPIRGPFERFGRLLGGATPTLGAVATIYGGNSPQHGCNSPQHRQSGLEKRFCSPGTGAHPATHAPPTTPLLVVAARRSRATPARDRPSRPTEATENHREQTRTSETASGRWLGRETDPAPASRRRRPASPNPRPTTRTDLSVPAATMCPWTPWIRS